MLRFFFLWVLTLAMSCLSLNAQIRLPHLISDGMVLQRDTIVRLWGWANRNETIILEFNQQIFKAQTDTSGKWTIELPPQKAGGPFNLVFKVKTKQVTSVQNTTKLISDVLFGDVWVCSGQSNMVLPIERVKEKYSGEIQSANYPDIRQFFVPEKYDTYSPQADVTAGSWKKSSPTDVLSFSALAYFFAKSLHLKYHVPIGIINVSVGGTRLEYWMPKGLGVESSEGRGLNRTIKMGQNTTPFTQFPTPNAPLANFWKNITVPGYWEDQGIQNLDGVVWYKKEFDVPQNLAGKEAKLFLGRIVDADSTFVNGVFVGNITYQYPPRRYTVPSGVLKAGKNTIMVRVTNYNGKGGFVPDKSYFLTVSGDTTTLVGTWQYKIMSVFETSGSPSAVDVRKNHGALFNGMIAPLTLYTIKGFVWNQGESNLSYPENYNHLLPQLIAQWRQYWGAPNLPFLFGQLPSYGDVNYLPTESAWAVLREGQMQSLCVPNTAMAVTIDLGEWNDIHPLRKKEVGERLALAAQNTAYGEKNGVYSGPLFSSATIEGNHFRLSFSNIGSGLVSSDGENLRWFAVADWDKKFKWADAQIVGNDILVSSEKISSPKYLRYAWADNPANINFYNKEGLPASPFRTDNSGDKACLVSAAWHGKKCAIVLSYDDAIKEHLDNAIPALDSFSLKGTFYLTAFADGFKNRLTDWRKAALNGHELGNHTLYHPCDGKLKGREWLNPENDLNKYSFKRLSEEIRTTNIMLKAIDGKSQRTFAYPCGDLTLNGQFFMDSLHSDFIAARAVRSEMHSAESIDLYNVDAYMVNGETGAQLIQLVKQAMQSNKLLVFLFHGVGGGHGLNVSLEAHRQLLEFLKQNETDVWVAPMVDIANFLIETRHATPLQDTLSLKDNYKNYFPIGVAVNPKMMDAGADKDLILSQFNSLTPENAMKMGPIHPAENRYNWADADKIINFAIANKLGVRGHNLCWHNQTPRWMFTDSVGNTVSKLVLLQRLEKHITDVVSHFKGKIYAWDVVNEAVPDTSNSIYRDTKFYQILGEEYIQRAFEIAHQADSAAQLFYNDYNTENPIKRQKIYQLLKNLKDKGVPIHGIGLQAHLSVFDDVTEIEKSIELFASLGLKIQITELDVSVYPKQHEPSKDIFSGKAVYTPDLEVRQTACYKKLFEIFRKHKNVISGVTFWNLSDRYSWLDNFPVRGRKDFPLLFDQNNQPKKAYFEVTKF